MKSLLLTLILVALCSGCEQPTMSSSRQPILPEAVGQTWTYIRTDWNSADMFEYRIYESETIAGDQWYSFDLGQHRNSLFTNRDDGMWIHSRYNDHPDLLLIKYGAWTGDTYGGEKITLHSIEGEPIPCIRSVHVDATNKSVSVPAGIFSCKVYTETIRGINSEALYEHTTYWVVPGIGFVRIKDSDGLYELASSGFH